LDINQILIFIIASIVLVFTPGPDIFHVLARGVGQGKKAGFAAVTGCSMGNLVHTALAVLGLSSLLASSETAFSIVKTIGAVYLIYIGVKLFREPFEPQLKMIIPMMIFLKFSDRLL
jgi:threonine/homoserine/homoserine lactone efflux protein